jgi:branched-chain amino acid transport system permease protein
MKNKYKILITMLIILCLMFVPLIFQDNIYLIFIFNVIGIYLIVNTGFDLLFGYCGQISLGQAGFYALGAYISTLLSMKLGLPVLLTIIIGASITALVGMLIAFPAAKLEHHFLALVTIGFGEIVRLIFLNGGKFTGGPDGIPFIPPLKIASISFDSYQMFFYVIWICVFIFIIIKQSLVKSRFGRAFMAIREDSNASSAFGINNTKFKVIAFGIAAFYAGMGGALYAHLVKFVSPESFTSTQSVLFLTMLLLGGSGSFWGPVIGTILLTFTFEFLQSFGIYQMAIYGLLIIFVLFFMPQGITGKVKELIQNMRHGKIDKVGEKYDHA